MSWFLLNRNLTLLEPYDWKLSRTVLRGERGSNAPDLPGIGLGGTQSAVYATEVSAAEYLAYTTEETEKMEVRALAEKLGGDIEAAIRELAEKRDNKNQ
jgi:hypothetical protein